MHRVFEIVGERFGDEAQNQIVRAACNDDQTSTIMLADDFADLREAYLDEEFRTDVATARANRLRRMRAGSDTPKFAAIA